LYELAAIALLVIVASIVLSIWKKITFVAATAGACIVIFGLSLAFKTLEPIAFYPFDLTRPAWFYTIVTSMYAHASIDHLLFNMIALVVLGIILEQRIGMVPFILLYFISGLIGTLAYAFTSWNAGALPVVGASGAISGILGGLGRLYPNERMAFLFFPMYPMRISTIVVIFVALQFIFVFWGDVAWQSHLGGLAAGLLLAPLVVKVRPREKRVRRGISAVPLRKLAVTPELKDMLRRIESETVPDVRSAWIEHFLSKARCPICGSPITVSRDSVRCSRGHLL
jgi:rhomboid protease GluP